MQNVLRVFFLALVCLAALGWTFATARQAPVEEIRHILRNQLVPAPAESELQTLTTETLAQDLEQLDPYARYITAPKATKSSADTSQQAGIGAQLFTRNGNVFLSPYPGGALARAGVTERSCLLEVDGHTIHDRTPPEVAAMLQGPLDSLVRLKLQMLSRASERTVTVVRSYFRPLDVERVAVHEQPVLRIRTFIAGQTRSALKASIRFLDLQTGPLIIDLRESGGGDLFEALDCAGLFIAQGKSLGGLITRESGKNMVLSPPGPKFVIPVILLVGPDTASAAEVFAAALDSHNRARLIGRPTFGKCTTQTEVTLSDGSILRFTNGRIVTPQGELCPTKGRQPDIRIPQDGLYDLEFLLEQAGVFPEISAVQQNHSYQNLRPGFR